jgi:hypothetical protein
MNGLRYRTRTPTSSHHRVAPFTDTEAQQNLPFCGNARLQA